MATKKRRGGKKVRAQKEKFATTEIHKQLNKRSFLSKNGEYGDDSMGLDVGMLGGESGGSGQLRGVEAKQKVKLSQSKMAIKRRGANGQSNLGGGGSGGGGGGATNGLASSVVFSQNQGLELVDPSRAKKVQDANQKWFGQGQGFASQVPK